MYSRLGPVVMILIALFCVAGCTSSPPPTPAPTSPSNATVTVSSSVNVSVEEKQLVVFVEEAAAFARENGRERSLAVFNDRNGSFVRGDLYVFAYDMNGTVLALPFQPEIVGIGRAGIVDLNGIAFIQDAIRQARNGSGYFRYHYPNPSHNYTIERKTSYVIGLGDWFVGAGFYETDLAMTEDPALRSRGDLVQYVEKAAAYARASGRDRAIRAFNDRNGSFVRGDLYVFAYDMNGTTLALPFQHELIGVDRANATDIQGTMFVQAAIGAAKNGSGFYELWYPNPADGFAVEPKVCYVVGMGDWFLGSGYYTGSTRPNATVSTLSNQ
jgi:polar amino acid transport system substrate-binding protein